MAGFQEMSPERHLEWTESINSRLENIYKELCDYEANLQEDVDGEPRLQLMELLETVNDIHNTAQSIHPVDTVLKSKQDNLHQQIDMLQRLVELMGLESKTKSVDVIKN